MANDTTLWPLEPHTVGKHMVLKAYLDAWLPIMGMTNDRILIIDGFAGPGVYDDGSPGSPVIALETLLNHQHRDRLDQEICFIFIEKDRARCAHLQKTLAERFPTLPANVKVVLCNGSFDATLNQVIDQIDQQNKALAPCFAMIDPFGVSDTPFNVIQRILANPKSEVFVSFMYSFLNRFKGSPEFAPHLDELYGCSEWRNGIDIVSTDSRRAFFLEMYKASLKRAGASNVQSFDLYRGNYHVYSIFFATKNLKGSDKMKQALWKVHPNGEFVFLGGDGVQMMIGAGSPDFSVLQQQLLIEFGPRGWVTIEAVSAFVMSDSTQFHSGHLKSNTLKPMEASGRLEVDEASRNRKGTYPDGTRLRFK